MKTPCPKVSVKKILSVLSSSFCVGMERSDIDAYARLCERQRDRVKQDVGGIPRMTAEVLKQACKWIN